MDPENNEYLDLELRTNRSTLNTKCSLFFAIISLCFLMKFYFDLSQTFLNKEILIVFFYCIQSLLPVSVILGSYYSLAAIITNEESVYKKGIAAFVNFSLMVIMAAGIFMKLYLGF